VARRDVTGSAYQCKVCHTPPHSAFANVTALWVKFTLPGFDRLEAFHCRIKLRRLRAHQAASEPFVQANREARTPARYLSCPRTADQVGKSTIKKANFVAGRKASAPRKTNQSAFVLAVTQGVDDAVGYRDWLFAIANKMTDPNRRTDATPALRLLAIPRSAAERARSHCVEPMSPRHPPQMPIAYSRSERQGDALSAGLKALS
jgi:hypothetical protein